MEIKQIITESVNEELSQFGLNEVERREFETIIEQDVNSLSETDDKEGFIKKRVKDFVIPSKLIQKGRTKYLQDIAQKEQELSKLREKKDEVKGDKEIKDDSLSAIEQAIAKLITPIAEQVTSLKNDNEELRKENKVKENKQTILSEAKGKYSDGVIAITAKNFDFSANDASDKFNTLCSENSTVLGVPIKKGDTTPKDDVPIELKDFLKEESLKGEKDRDKAKEFEKKFR